ncbi:M20/M25/M40 family metallo-hydrolase [Streptomyces sp. NBC_00057]|uniref:M20/M25/M40 family metallo-hydrolase n=1 Tax=Streptomyces sp. NBC_00057 TaxID=2975634 RepID=UPI0032432834
MGSLAGHPFEVAGGRLTGPGCFDMKAGVVQLFHALSVLDDLDGVSVLLTGDEEIGSPTSRTLIEAEARRAGAVLVLEASEGGAVKTARKGVSGYELNITGRAAHAGLEPQRGVNTTTELAHQVLALSALADPATGTTVTPTVASSGTTRNTVPDAARLLVDVRVETAAEQDRVDRAMQGLAPVLTGAGGPDRPPLQASASAELFELARSRYAELGFGPLHGVAVTGEPSAPDRVAAGHRIAEPLALHLAAIHPRTAAASLGGVTYAVLPTSSDEHALRVAEAFLGRIGNRVPAVIGIGRLAARPAELRRSRADADRALRVLGSGRSQRRAARLSDV